MLLQKDLGNSEYKNNVVPSKFISDQPSHPPRTFKKPLSYRQVVLSY